MRNGLAALLIVLGLALPAWGAGNADHVVREVANIQSSDSATVQQTIADLRAAGAGGLAALLQAYDLHPDVKLLPAIDAVAGQHDAVYSRLYWYTDLAQAESAAKAQHKPILYLRLLGKPTDQYSCANSRFFRTALYSNKAVSTLLRDNFVLVWVSERPVPVVTIDYGDGRVLKRTLTGNSIHYVLDSNGQVYDALPGLFAPETFFQIVNQAGQAARWEMDRGKYLRRCDDGILRQWEKDTRQAGLAALAGDAETSKVVDQADAAAAMRRTYSKAMVEAPLLRDLAPQFAAEMDQSIDGADDSRLQKIADLHAADATLDAQSIALIKSQDPAAYADPAVLDQTVHQFQRTIAEDSVRDNFKMRKQVLAWLLEKSAAPVAVEDLNRRVYSNLFMTPRSDPWLGLAPKGLYTALPDDGCCSTAAPVAAQ